MRYILLGEFAMHLCRSRGIDCVMLGVQVGAIRCPILLVERLDVPDNLLG